MPFTNHPYGLRWGWQMCPQAVPDGTAGGPRGSARQPRLPSVSLRKAGRPCCSPRWTIYVKVTWQVGRAQINVCPHIPYAQLQSPRRERIFSEKSVGCKYWHEGVFALAKPEVHWEYLVCLAIKNSSLGITMLNKCKFWFLKVGWHGLWSDYNLDIS